METVAGLREGKRSFAVQERTKAVVAVIIGNGFEWFDFISYGFFSVIIAKIFFPTSDDNLSLLLSVSTIGVGFFMRPVGGIVLGGMADKIGRRATLVITITLMTIGTSLIAFAPTYKDAGIFAPLMIVCARLLQGFSAGGEMGGATGFLRDNVPAERLGYYTSWIQASIGFAIILASVLAVVLVKVLSAEQVESWGWRIPFLIGLCLGPLGIYIRNQVHEPAEENVQIRERTPVLEIVRRWKSETLIGFGLVIFWTVCSYVLLFYIPTYASKVLHLPASTGFIAVLVGASIVLFVTPVFGYLSDRYGRRRFLMGALAVAVMVAYPMFRLLNVSPGLHSLLLFQVVFGLVIACYEGPILAALSDAFPRKIVSTGISISYNLAVITFGGFSAAILTWAIAATQNNLAPAFYVMGTAVLSFFAAACWSPRKG
ncbi:MFS transporter [Burkholderia thailandensis]|uniref:MFS transporter n=1 Tax=Burkholderia thailandensis TaxID=57975 RepID=UPI0007552BD6|nr:MFS transporter [Burkholderia thailandensis]KVG08781.1 MFS transporter [Burkholderia thailandensis]MCS3399565.1 MFS transporter [Burkholderia thailandensis]MCS6478367.1 MFS transporter [Burkholderia thailandensis]MCS6503462.1 MFS transporter [Burkholderia thailandensis]MCS6509181.1 MFS transporter [Burkholderia thailandensis]